MIRILLQEENGIIKTDLQLDQLPAALANPTNVIWVDIHDMDIPTIDKLLNTVFKFNPLAIEDALYETHIPKVDDWYDYLYLVLRAASLSEPNLQNLAVPELDVFLGDNFIISYTIDTIPSVDRVWNICKIGEYRPKRSAAYILYQLVDELVADAVAVVEQMHDELGNIEEQVLGQASPDVLADLFRLKRNILKLRRITIPQRDVLNKLSRNEYHVITEAHRIFFRDVYDHLLQLNDLLEDILLLVSGALDMYLSVVNNRMNDIMKTLTIITAFFMPLSFITGFFGMNFFQAIARLDAWTGITAFILVMMLMIFIPFSMFTWMRRRYWI